MAQIEEDLYTVEHLMKRYKKTRGTILRWAREKKIESLRPGGKVYQFTAQHIADFDAKSSTPPAKQLDPQITEHLKRSRARRASNRAKAAASATK